MISVEDAWNHGAQPPPELASVLASLSRPELIVLLEDIAPRFGGMAAPGMVRLAEVLFAGAQWELTAREFRKVKDRAMFDALAASLLPAADDPVGDITGIPPWSEASSD